MPQGDINQTYKSNELRIENIIPTKLNAVEFRGNDPTNLNFNPMRIWARTDTGELKYTVDGVNKLTVPNRSELPFVNVKWFGAKGNGIADDTAAIQTAVSSVVATGGLLFFPAGNYNVFSAITFNTSNAGKRFVICGAGIGVTNINVKADVSGFSGSGYLYDITNMSINKSFTGTSTKYGIYCTGGGRRVLSLLQVSGFYNAFRQDGSFDMFSIDKCTFVNSVDDGSIININDNKSCALLSITDSLFNNNGGNGFTLLQTSGQLINFKTSNTEFIDNTKHAFYAESTTGQPITGIMIESCDFEHVKAGYSGIKLKNVYKIMIENCAFNVFDVASEAVIYLDSCRDGVVQSPWYSDSITTANKVFVTQNCDAVYLIGSRQSISTKVGFTTVAGQPVPITCLNFDDLYRLFQYQYFMMGPQYNTNDLTRVVLQGVYTTQMPTGVQSRVTIPFNNRDNNRQISQIQVVWFNNSPAISTGNVRWTLFNSSNEGVAAVFSNQTAAVGAYRAYQTTNINVGSLPYDTNYGVTPIAVLRNGTDAADTFTGDACLVAVRIIFK